ncbi:bis(5'-nucleosyl)-tetraphosphatase (symmetrical) [Alkalilimnicola ehrlichii]|uniref:Bis(5'-nucleosyl)-tetraphosphatase, symmetrical n=1 Tax=Alkalilimnicola ehrlichii TaxID=351052 RepID=A0A3E0X446_9GAMM|nr:symmetrical bis(5'-nucleosyl)-tetraphosphatase [Alkalilimnicola ehrlichii]RFA31269.1 bis(5'-nucleosyl)-tetraphosphatase (symmetrical) [Alkalilimnicola ehrlichii]RFA39455.1 bis(5'-nucleosyl)-tetraphosphatase (symmetrical) [Alkalilimnicola ehrlichii]
MAVYAIGDIQGCLEPLERLLERLRFDPAQDHLWLTGDLVNRGPSSLEVLRLARSLGDRAITVLGNHDIHLLAVAAGQSKLKRNDSLQQILDAPDANELMDWLRTRPLLHHDPDLKAAMVHAGLFPHWSLEEGRRYAAEAEEALRGERFPEFMAHLYGDEPAQWDPALHGWDRLRFIINTFTRMRYCAPNGRLLMDFKGAPADRPKGYLPWYKVPGRKHTAGDRIVFGHWSTLGFRQEDGVISLDTGCLWGGQLTAARLDGPFERISLECPVAMKVGSDPHHY